MTECQVRYFHTSPARAKRFFSRVTMFFSSLLHKHKWQVRNSVLTQTAIQFTATALWRPLCFKVNVAVKLWVWARGWFVLQGCLKYNVELRSKPKGGCFSVTGCLYCWFQATTERSIIIWDHRAKAKNHASVHVIKPLEHSPQCMCIAPSDDDHSDSVLIGDDAGKTFVTCCEDFKRRYLLHLKAAVVGSSPSSFVVPRKMF